MSSTLRTPEALARAGLVAPDQLPALERVAARYAVAVTPAFAALIEHAHDPIGLQMLPSPEELEPEPGASADPTGDAPHTPVKGIVHRYPDRVLLKPTHTCAVYCRFCFRREAVGPEGAGRLTAAELDAALTYVAARPEIWEVIVTGGDPLVLSPRRLRDLGDRLAEIEHVRVVRFHTRVPVAAPEEITPERVAALRIPGKAVYVALHANHPRELTPAARAACAAMVDSGVPMISQTVLLRGVNDDPEVLGTLMRAFVETRIKPYYLHHLDAAPGTGRFRVPVPEGQAIMRTLRGRWSGLCQPTYVLDTPGGFGKVSIGPCAYSAAADGSAELEDPWGGVHPYPADH